MIIVHYTENTLSQHNERMTLQQNRTDDVFKFTRETKQMMLMFTRESTATDKEKHPSVDCKLWKT